MSWSKEDRLLLHCCRIGIDNRNKDEIIEIQRNNIDWDCFLKKARNEGISPLGFRRLPEIVKNDGIPLYVKEELKKDFYLNATKNTLIFEELKRVLKLFHQRGIQVVVLKGAALAETVYGNLALRPMSDVDLLARKDNLHQIDELFKELGYSPSDRSVDDIDFTSSYLMTLDYRNPVKNSASFHLHWHFVNSTIPSESYTRHIEMEDIWREVEKTNIADTETWVMSPHHLLIHLSEHALRVPHSMSRLIYFCDIGKAINFYGERLDWDRLVKDALKFNLNKMVYMSLYFTSCFLAAKVPEDVLLKLRPKRLNLAERIFMNAIARNNRRPGLSYLIHLSMNKGLLKKLRFVGRTFFPPRAILAQRNYVPESEVNYKYYLRRIKEVSSHIVKL